MIRSRAFTKLRLLVLVLTLGGVSACQQGQRGDCEIAALDEATMAILETARTLHHEADVFEDSARYDDAIRTIERLLALPIPRSILEGREIRLDAYGRLAELQLAAGAPPAALRVTELGLAEAKEDSVFFARLHTLRGRSLRALAEQAQRDGDGTKAQQFRQQAIEALESSLAINARVLARVQKAQTR